MNYYELCVKKHLYFHGRSAEPGRKLTYLSKNPSFTPFVESLKERFPNAHIVACTREPEATVPSQLNSLKPSQELIGLGIPTHRFNTRMIELLLHYYKTIQKNQNTLRIVEMTELNNDLEQLVKKLYLSFDRVLEPVFADTIRALSERSRKYKSEHRYDLASYELTLDQIENTFAPYWPIEQHST
jgi:hypothetical protein